MASNETVKKQVIMDELEAKCLKATGENLPDKLYDLLYRANEISGSVRDPEEGPQTDAEVQKYIYRSLFSFLSMEREVGHGAALVYPEEVLTAVRKMYPDGVKNYRPIAGKRKRLHEVFLNEMVQEYRTATEEEP